MVNGAVTSGLLKSLEDKMGAAGPGTWGQRSGHQTEDLPPPFRADTQAEAEDVTRQMSPHLAPHLTQQLTCKHHHHTSHAADILTSIGRPGLFMKLFSRSFLRNPILLYD